MHRFLKSLVLLKENSKFKKYSINLVQCSLYSTNSFVDKNSSAYYFTHPNLSYTTTTTSSFSIVLDTINDHINKYAKTLPNKFVFGFPHQGINLTFNELKQRVDIAAQNLLDLDFKKGDRIALAIPNVHEFVILFLAASQIGVITVALNPAYQLTELEYMLKKTGAKGLVIYDSFRILKHLELIRKICPELDSCNPGELKSKNLPNLKHIFILNSPLIPTKQTYKGTWSFNILSEPKSTNIKHELPYVEMDDPCLIMFTSGTTGKPKGALMSQSSLLNSAYISTAVVDHPDGLKMLCNPIPVFHIFGLATGILIPLIMGTSLVFPFYFPETVSSMKAIQAYKCNTFRGVPTQFVDLLNHPERKNFDLSSLQNLIVGGSTVLPELITKLKENLKIKSIIVGYGMTETSYCHSVVTYEEEQTRGFKYAYESCGRSIPFTESKIIDIKTGQIQPHNVEGELCIRGIHLIKKYWDEPEKTKETINENGWLHTGDIFSMDSKGFLFFKSRHKDVIIRGGANVYPAEIESYLCTHPSIADAQAFGVPDERLQEEICVWIKLKPGCNLTEDELRNYCKDKISQFKIPRYIKFVDSFPINANNKILKNIMRQKAIEELGQKK